MEARDGSIWAGTAWGALRLTTQDALLHASGDMAEALKKLATLRPTVDRA